jgi:hypothetical protein
MTTPTTKRAPKDTAEPKPATRRTRKAEPKPVEPAPTPKAERGPRGEVLARHGVVLEDGSTVRLAFAEFECAKGEAGWTTICTAHGTRHPAATKAEAEKAGARRARAGWCKGCPNSGRLAKACAKDAAAK